MNTHGYGRVSTDKQENSARAQADAWDKAAAALGLPPLTGQFMDKDTSGAIPFAKRQEGRRLLESARPGDHLIVTRFDRLGRSLRDVEDTIKLFADRGIELHLLDFFGMRLDSNNPTAMLIVRIAAAAAQWEREMRRARLVETNAHRRSLGLPTNNKRPYGYRFEGHFEQRKLVPDPEEQQRRNLFYEMRRNTPKYSFKEIAQFANRKGWRNSEGRPWNLFTMRRVIKAVEAERAKRRALA